MNEPAVTLELLESGRYVAHHRTRVYRYLLSDGSLVDVEAARDDSVLRSAVLIALANERRKDVSIEGSVVMPDEEPPTKPASRTRRPK